MNGRILSASILLLTSAAQAGTPLSKAALADRARIPAADHPFVFYLVGDATTQRLLCWVLSSTSRQPEIEQCLPVPIVAGLSRIDIRTLNFRHQDWREVLRANPYGGFCMIVRGDWLATEILDTQLSASRHSDGVASYYRLLYGDRVPKTEADFLKFWEVDTNAKRHRGQIEGVSQVNRRGRRWIERRETFGGYAWITRDSQTLTTKTDPLESPTPGSFAHDGAELIIGATKFSSVNQQRGTVQYYLLANGKGNRVEEAPVQLVEDSTRFRGVPTIRTWGSCVQCHTKGLQPLDSNALVNISREYETAVFSTNPDELRRFHFGSLDKEIIRSQEDYETAVRLHAGWTGEQLADAVSSVVEGYDAALDLGRAAAELGASSEQLQAVIRSHGQAHPIPAGISMLAGGGKCSRDLFEEQFGFLDGLMMKYHARRSMNP